MFVRHAPALVWQSMNLKHAMARCLIFLRCLARKILKLHCTYRNIRFSNTQNDSRVNVSSLFFKNYRDILFNNIWICLFLYKKSHCVWVTFDTVHVTGSLHYLLGLDCNKHWENNKNLKKYNICFLQLSLYCYRNGLRLFVT